MRLNFSDFIIRYSMQLHLSTSVLKILLYFFYKKIHINLCNHLQSTEYYREIIWFNKLSVCLHFIKKFIMLTIRNALLRKYT